MQTDAPNFRGTYPLAGERIGPAWRAAWTRLSESQWTCGGDIVAEVAPGVGIADATVANLLRQARQAGILAVEHRVPPGRKARASYYRVNPGAWGGKGAS
jgi:hypothetical protein